MHESMQAQLNNQAVKVDDSIKVNRNIYRYLIISRVAWFMLGNIVSWKLDFASVACTRLQSAQANARGLGRVSSPQTARVCFALVAKQQARSIFSSWHLPTKKNIKKSKEEREGSRARDAWLPSMKFNRK